jgi:pimeloyl-ACP methyl ester carboxylesterase
MDETTIRQAAERLHFTCMGDGTDDILLIHGFASSLRIWEPLTAALPHAARWWALDLCGFGQSASLSHAAPTLDDHVRVIAAFCAQRSLRPRIVMGHSMGGMLTLKLALALPGLMERLVLMCPVVTGKISFRTDLILGTNVGTALLGVSRPLWSVLQSRVAQPLMRIPRFYLSPRARLRVAEDFRCADWRAASNALNAISQEDLTRRLPSIQHPALVIVGGRDFTVPPSEGRAAARLMPNAGLVEFPSAHHEPLDEETDECVATVAAFLKKD